MNFLFGRYECKVDAKGRMRLPSRLLEQLGSQEELEIIINFGHENSLLLFPVSHLNDLTLQVMQLNEHIEKNRQYKRIFFEGIDKIKVDSADRILLSKSYQQFAQIEGDVLITPMGNYFEMWNPEVRNQHVPSKVKERSEVGEEVMGQEGSGYSAGGMAPTG
ncbi:MAG: division/cell wall cluster transcriptional repressor MraZ [Saprospiraceae bacterium]